MLDLGLEPTTFPVDSKYDRNNDSYHLLGTCYVQALCEVPCMYCIDIGVDEGELHHVHAHCCRPLFLITCTLYLWHMLLTRPLLPPKFSQAWYTTVQCLPLWLHLLPPSLCCTTLASAAFSQLLEYAKHISTSRPLNLLFRLPGSLFLRDIYSCFFASFGSLLKHLLIVKPSLNNGRKTAQGSATIPLLPISLILLYFCSLFFLITSWHILWFFIVCLCFIRSSVLFTCFPSN